MEELEQPKLTEIQNNQNITSIEGEQENNVDNKGEDVAKEPVDSFEEESSGSNIYLGKFNSVQDLENAYNSLQAEFTRKCQKLKMVEEEIEASKNINEGNAQESPLYLQQDYNEKLSAFLQSFPNAKKYAKEISLEVINNNIQDFNQAYNNVLAKLYKEPEELVKDKDFINNYILNDDDVKKELIKKYLKDVKESNAPTLISGASGLGGGRAKDIEISSLEEANKLALKMFKE